MNLIRLMLIAAAAGLTDLAASWDVFQQFNDVAELNDYLDRLPVANGDDAVSFHASFRSYVLLDRPVDLTRLGERLNLGLFSLRLANVRGFVVSPSAMPIVKMPYFKDSEAKLTLDFTFLDFYDASGRPLGASCDDYLMSFHGLTRAELEAADKLELMRNFAGLFTVGFPSLTISTYVHASRPICPLVLKSMAFQQIMLNTGFQETFIRRELFEFSAFEPTAFDLKARVYSLIVNDLRRSVSLDRLLDARVFGGAVCVTVFGTLSPLGDEALFRSFAALRKLYLVADNAREFVHASTNVWLGHLNPRVQIDPTLWSSSDRDTLGTLYGSAMSLALRDARFVYEYPDADFCLFRHFPHDHNVLFSSENNAQPTTCLYLYLFQNTRRAYVYVHPEDGSVGSEEAFVRACDKCEFARRLELCAESTNTTMIGDVHETTLTDFIYATEVAELIGPVITFPFVSAIGFVLNALVVLVVRDPANRTKHFKGNRIYQFIALNSAFNAAECLISTLTLLNECLGYGSIFCSTVQADYGVQLFKIVVVAYLGECMKTCSIVMLLAFSVERFVQTTACSSPLARRLAAASVRSHVLFAVVFAFASSTCKFFEYRTKPGSLLSVELPELNTFRLIGEWWFAAIYAVHYVLNDGALLLANLLVDVVLVVHIKQNLAKKERFGAERSGGFGHQHKLHSDSTVARLKAEKKSTEAKMNKMIVYQVALFTVCRLPELVYALHFFVVRNDADGGPLAEGISYEAVCTGLSLCYFMFNVIQYLYMFSYSVNVYFFYKFNKPFRHGFREYVSERLQKNAFF